jgi:molybdate transport system substrate-binding protein
VLRVPLAEFVGAIPAEVQLVTMFSAAIVKTSISEVQSRRLIAHLASEAAAAAIRRSGMEPIAAR